MTDELEESEKFPKYYVETHVYNPKINAEPDAPFHLTRATMNRALYVVGISADGTREVLKDMRPFSQFRQEPKERPRFNGRRLFADDFEQLRGNTHVIESSLAFEGAHCWIYQDRSTRWEGKRKRADNPDPGAQDLEEAKKVRDGDMQCVHLNVEGAKKIRDALSMFIDEAEAGELLEGVDPIPEEEEKEGSDDE